MYIINHLSDNLKYIVLTKYFVCTHMCLWRVIKCFFVFVYSNVLCWTDSVNNIKFANNSALLCLCYHYPNYLCGYISNSCRKFKWGSAGLCVYWIPLRRLRFNNMFTFTIIARYCYRLVSTTKSCCLKHKTVR